MAAVLVTGAAGFLGSHLAGALVRAGHAVVGLDDLSGGFARNVPPGVEFLQGSILDHKQLDWLFGKYRFDYVFHFAAYAAEGLSHFIRRFNYTNNLVGSANLVNAAVSHGVKRFVFASSIAVYGDARNAPFHEGQHPEPADPYGIAKYAVELDLAAANALFGLDYTVFRLHNVWGPHQHIGDRYRNVVGIFMNQLLRGEPLTLFGDGLQTRAFTYVDDVLEPLVRCAEMPETAGQVYNLGTDEVHTVREIAEACISVSGRPASVVSLQARVEAQHAFSTHLKLRRTFSAAEATPLPVGLKRMWDWAVRLGPQTPTRFGAIEVEKNLPPSYRSPK